MMFNRRPGVRDESGFSLIELLVVVLMVGILAAIAIPSFLNQKSKAQDAQAKTMARTAQTAFETYAASNGGSYAGSNLLSTLNSVEPSLITGANTSAFLSAVQGTTNSFQVTAYSPVTSESFMLTDTAGSITRTCSPSGGGGCPSNGTW
jgi:type IV pilus assembly protein PilA